MVSMKPEALKKGLDYVREIQKKNEMHLYRIVPINEITNFEGSPKTSAVTLAESPNGIAIINADSIEKARDMISKWLEGLSYGGLPIKSYLNYEIKPLMEIGKEGE